MENLHRQFLDKSAADLTKLTENLQKSRTISAELRRKCFRTLHTIKGTAQTFGFENAGFLAHELENLLASGKNDENFSDARVFIEGLVFLQKLLKNTDFELPQNFLNKIYRLIPKSSQKKDFSLNLIGRIPFEFTKTLSRQEKNALVSALEDGKNLFCVEVKFALKNFAEEFKNFRAELSRNGEITAAFPGANSPDKIGFRFILNGNAETSDVEKTIEPFSAKIIYKKLSGNIPDSLPKILDEIIAHGKDVAERSGKKVEFEIAADELKISAENLKLIFDILLHLVRNAVDHAIETPKNREKAGKNANGKIRISAENVDRNDLLLQFSDDGKGIDRGKLKAKALEKNFITNAENLSEKATLELIFQSELSTADHLTEISGRGVGLDVVKSLIVEKGGKISVGSEKGKGTSFKVFLPKFCSDQTLVNEI